MSQKWLCAVCTEFNGTQEEVAQHLATAHPFEECAEGPVAKTDTRTFASGATRDQDDSKLDYEGFLSPVVLERYAQYMHEARLRNVPAGMTIRPSDNWQKGIPKSAYVKSLIRHTFEVWKHWRQTGTLDQNAACGIMFNVMGLLFEDLHGR